MSRATPPDDAALRLAAIRFVRGDTTILDGVDVVVRPGERWLLLGPNGCGKTSLLRIAALYEHPSSGVVEVLGERLGATDVRVLRRRIGFVSAALADQLRPTLSAFDAVRTARYGALEPWWHRYTPDDDARARELPATMGVARLADHALVTLSSGERSRVLLARSLMNEPAVVLLDEPAAGLDLAGREQLVDALDHFAGDAGRAPARRRHPSRRGRTDVADPRDADARRADRGRRAARRGAHRRPTSATRFGLELRLDRRGDGRFSAWAVR